EDWWPWPNKKECLMDLMGAFPRSVFSDAELEVTRWFTNKLGVRQLPTPRLVKKHRVPVLNLAGSDPKLFQGSLGHVYSVASLSRIIQHEMANPRVRPHLRFYPEDARPEHRESFHADRWRMEVDAALSGPMARAVDGQDYYVEEPAVAYLGDSGHTQPQTVWPTRWFQRADEMYALVHLMTPDPQGEGYFIETEQCLQLPLSAFFINYERFKTMYMYYGLQDPSKIQGINPPVEHKTSLKSPVALIGLRQKSVLQGSVTTVSYEVSLPNPWRVKAKGRRIAVLPFWLYCDDTSGNVSKKWNKHNSFLFVFAGLPFEHASLSYNIHFLSTSNLAPPLEMAEQIAKDIKETQTNGVAAWDCVLNEEVLCIPWILALLGDNPMQSELSSHIGLTGKFFCRVCHVRGKDKNRPPGSEGEQARIMEFKTVGAGTARSRAETLQALEDQLEQITNGVPSRADAVVTETGVKDRHFVPFFDSWSAACGAQKERNRSAGKPEMNGVRELIQRLRAGRAASHLFNPLLQFADLDPNADTPVEILHVVLLGFVKYFWRDAVSRQNSQGKKILKTRLSSLDVADLQTSPLRGHTLVQYAGSLTGRDFRVVVQVAPAVLYGMVPAAGYRAWLALCHLAPLAFQSKITSLDSYLSELQHAIDDFLSATAAWNPQWFNKPKFHILLHLPLHVKRFGPPPLTATEGFESYNFVIRLRSIHSNRQGPSTDIAQSMSFMHAARHLVSGGLVLSSADARSPRTAGKAVLDLLEDEIFVKFMGMTDVLHGDKKTKIRMHLPVLPWSETLSSRCLHSRLTCPPSDRARVGLYRSASLQNGDICRLQGFIMFRIGDADTCLGRIEEIVHGPIGLVGIMVRRWDIQDDEKDYQMPRVSPTGACIVLLWEVSSCRDILCCAHTFHNCARQKCISTLSRQLRMERTLTDQFDAEFRHDHFPDDRILNLAQLRSVTCYELIRAGRR
ncbi:hypothetical protein DENSPDRAFT_756058, partial [Dentipellis sp. KUC8613]